MSYKREKKVKGGEERLEEEDFRILKEEGRLEGKSVKGEEEERLEDEDFKVAEKKKDHPLEKAQLGKIRTLTEKKKIND